ncbi:inosine-uridine nucleoside N-ribohydrolase [Acetobacter nitrogenifigens DSM 23921 = NBRC 105050]|uniref:Nucleoside hydrolase n=2 Tax=Acetobacter nitrogenifigens TaxID=285268 RepID=A0A511XC28_9PROT|nr:nucleoside hydrolase [Acetobacter nitrogenifigens]GBQ88887.1 inosine-uridine nucleoside N-ribohydrolase [Acetobacter nitrogenifigens DSM 23921 = NBRC 105050]GEN60518.1 nucleoside hydrolase [Acetobacter nitrogenifigens DSM 23921 = NBRC 105050]
MIFDRMTGAVLRRVSLAAALTLSIVATATAASPTDADQNLVFIDNDFSGPGETNIESLYPALSDPHARLLGVGAVTGDAWRDEGAAHLLAFLKQVGCPSLPLYLGAEMPLVRTANEMYAWEAQYGRIIWKGAWQPASPRHPTGHPDQPSLIPAMPEGFTPTLPHGESAAHAMIDAVHRYPHQVTIVAGGPLTDVALAIKLDSEFAGLAKQLVFMGGLLDTDHPQIAVEKTHEIDFYTDFNMIFDPEAAHIVLTAPWRSITNMGNVTLGVLLKTELREQAKGKKAPLAAYFARYAQPGIPMWDELTTAVALHPELVTSSVDATMDVEIARGMFYGRAHARPLSLSLKGAPVVHIVTAVDAAKFYQIFAEGFDGSARCSQ